MSAMDAGTPKRFLDAVVVEKRCRTCWNDLCGGQRYRLSSVEAVRNGLRTSIKTWYSCNTEKKMMDYQLQYASAAIESYRLQTSYLLNLQQLRRRLKNVTNNFSGRSALNVEEILALLCSHWSLPEKLVAVGEISTVL